jgi:hypothetical protein
MYFRLDLLREQWRVCFEEMFILIPSTGDMIEKIVLCNFLYVEIILQVTSNVSKIQQHIQSGQ